MTEIPNIHEQVFVNALRAEMNGKASATIDSFSGWLLAGFGAASALLVSQFETVSKHIDSSTIKCFLSLFLWSLVLAVVQKYLSVIVTAHSQGSAIGREMGEKNSEKGIKLNFDLVLAEMEKSTLPPGRWLLSRSFAKLKQGDLVSSTRTFSKLMQIQSIIAVVQAILMLMATYIVARSFHA